MAAQSSSSSSTYVLSAASTGALVRREPGLAAVAVMALAGIGISIYLTTIHYANIAPVCTTGGIVDCSSVLLSKYSLVPGTSIPITIPGLLWFLVAGGMALAGLLAAARGEPAPEWLSLLLFVWSALGLLTVLYLVYAEIVALQRICEWCTVVHVMTLATFLIAFRRLQAPPTDMAQEAESVNERAQRPRSTAPRAIPRRAARLAASASSTRSRRR